MNPEYDQIIKRCKSIRECFPLKHLYAFCPDFKFSASVKYYKIFKCN